MCQIIFFKQLQTSRDAFGGPSPLKTHFLSAGGLGNRLQGPPSPGVADRGGRGPRGCGTGPEDGPHTPACPSAGPVYTSRFSPCGALLASGSGDCRISIYDMNQRAVRHMLEAHTAGISDLSWATDSAALISASLERGDRAVILWDVATAQVRLWRLAMAGVSIAVGRARIKRGGG